MTKTKQYIIMDKQMTTMFSNVLYTEASAKLWFKINHKTEGGGFIIAERTVTYSDWEPMQTTEVKA